MSALTRILAQLAPHTTPQGEHTGIMVALAIPHGDAVHLAVPGGESADELHVTLAYLGRSDALQDEDVARYAALARELRALTGRTPPLTLTLTGAGSFDTPDGDAHYLDVDGPGLRTLRAEVMFACDHAGLQPSRKHPEFRPHITLRYGGAHPDPAPPRISLRVPELSLWIAGTRVAYPFAASGMTLAKADAELGRGADTAGAQARYAQLTGDLIGLSRQGRALDAQVAAVLSHHTQAAEGLGAAIRAPRGSALEDAYLEHAAEAQTARSLPSA